MNMCPCSPNRSYEDCCGPFIEETAYPKTAEALMRSRYTAFTQSKTAYIGATQKGKAAANYSPESTAEWIAHCVWMGLEVLETKAIDETTASVSFKAHYKEKGIPRVIHENSLFEYDGTRWFYVGGSHVARNAEPKIGRNDPCPCQSGQKYKKCCGKN